MAKSSPSLKSSDRLDESEGDSLLGQIIESSPVPTFVIDRNHVVTHWNHACSLITGYASDKIIGSNETWKVFYPSARPVMADFILDSNFEAIAEYYTEHSGPSEIVRGAWEAEGFFPHFPNGGKWLALTTKALLDNKGEIIGAIETLQDITRQKNLAKQAEENQHLLSQIIDASPVPMFVINKDHKVTHWNKACEAIIGNDANNMIGTNKQWAPFYPDERPVLADLVLSEDAGSLQKHYSGIWDKSPLVKGAWEATSYFPNFKKGAKWLYFTASQIRGLNGDVVGAVETLQDVTERKEYEEQLRHQANHDSLTGLPNRSLLYDRLSQAIAHAKREDRFLGLLFIDLDDFKLINDNHGHSAGDYLLRVITERIRNCIRESDTAARLGGDEFVVLLFSPCNENDIRDVIERLAKSIKKPVLMNGIELQVGCSIGVSLYPKNGTNPEQLMTKADSAMYQAKKNDKGNYFLCEG